MKTFAVGVVHDDMMTSQFVRSLAELLEDYVDIRVIFGNGESGAIADGRNRIVHEFLEDCTAEYLLWIDTDQVFQSYQASALLVSGRDVVGAMIATDEDRTNAFSYEDATERITDFAPRGEIKVSAIGCGFTAVRRDVFEGIGAPWYEFTQHTGEDVRFCDNAQAAGFTVWMNTDIRVGHVKLRVI